MRFLWYDIFKDGQSVKDAPREWILEETRYAWASTIAEDTRRFFLICSDDDKDIVGAVVHWEYPSFEVALDHAKNVPWLVHDFADGKVTPYTNFTSISKLFGQDNKYAGLKPIQRLQPFSTDPTVTWYALVSPKESSSYDVSYGVEDALACFRLIQGSVAEEVFDMSDPEQGKILRIKANDRAEVEEYLKELKSVKEAAANVTILRTRSICAWEQVFF